MDQFEIFCYTKISLGVDIAQANHVAGVYVFEIFYDIEINFG